MKNADKSTRISLAVNNKLNQVINKIIDLDISILPDGKSRYEIIKILEKAKN